MVWHYPIRRVVTVLEKSSYAAAASVERTFHPHSDPIINFILHCFTLSYSFAMIATSLSHSLSLSLLPLSLSHSLSLSLFLSLSVCLSLIFIFFPCMFSGSSMLHNKHSFKHIQQKLLMHEKNWNMSNSCGIHFIIYPFCVCLPTE